jgi:sulfite exporter TauE/SafE
MYLLAIAWLYVALLAAIADTTVVGGVLTFLFFGLGPLALFMWLFGTGARRRRREARESPPGKDNSLGKNPSDQ